MTTVHPGATAPLNPASGRVNAIIEQMTLREKLAQLVGFWQDEAGDVVAPLQGQRPQTSRLTDAVAEGLGHLTRPYGTNPVEPDERAAWLWSVQRDLVTRTRLGIPAIVHEECLTGLAAWKAATFPTPTAWGAAFAPELVEQMAGAIGASMRGLGVHQGLAPVLDVIRDPRWGRVDECIAEDPYLVGEVGTAFVRGLQGAGVHATLKHFVGYSASTAGRNFAPVHAGPREVADELLIPFEMAVKDGGVRAVMAAYTQLDGVPTHADSSILTDLLRDQWGFDGVVVADYFGVAFLQVLHGAAANLGDAAAQALLAGLDVELPSGDAYLHPLEEAVESGAVPVAAVDRAVARVLAQKEELGLLDETFEGPSPTGVDLDSPTHRRIARELAERSIVLLSNDGTLPLAADASIALIGPNADRASALFGCYSFVNHVLAQRPGFPMGFAAPSVREALASGQRKADYVEGCDVDGDSREGFEAAIAAAASADVAVIVAGDRAGLFGRGTVGEGCDVESLELPGVQRELIEAVAATGTPVVLVLMTGRPYAITWALESCAAVIQTFFPGEEGGTAVVDVLTGAVNPSGRLPVTMPRSTGAQPYTYLHTALGGDGDVTSVGSTPARPFGFGLSYTSFGYGPLSVTGGRTDAVLTASVTVTNTGGVAGEEVVQLYARDVLGSIPRPVAQLVGFRRVALAPGESATVTFTVPTTRIAFSDRALRRIVEPGTVELWVGDAATRVAEGACELTGDVYVLTGDEPRFTTSAVS